VIIYSLHGRTFGNTCFHLGKMWTFIPFGISGTMFKLRVLLQNTFDLSIIMLYRARLVQFVPTDFNF